MFFCVQRLCQMGENDNFSVEGNMIDKLKISQHLLKCRLFYLKNAGISCSFSFEQTQ